MQFCMKKAAIAIVPLLAVGALYGVYTLRQHADRKEQEPKAATKTAPSFPPESVLPPEERERAMALLQHLKQLANVAFQEGRYEEALTLYQNCLKVTQALGGGDSENVVSDQVIRSNVVMTLIKLSQYDDARLVATVLLQDEQYPLAPDLKVKLLYRRGIASKQLGDKSSAISDFKSAIHFSPDQKNPMAEAELNRLTR